ncbi:MAG: hypothetical protein GY702_23200, partial [Desulfobulbaceae bacterium]|nr:hypothetical protein [Desulfobulbaceae bacterium]
MNSLKETLIFSILIICLVASNVIAGSASSLPSLQELIEQTPEGREVQLIPGRYSGPVIINKPVILDGKGK